MFEPRDAPYPELKTTHTMAHTGRPWTDYKPPPAAPVWAAIEGLGRYYILLAALELDVFDTLQRLGPSRDRARSPTHSARRSITSDRCSTASWRSDCSTSSPTSTSSTTPPSGTSSPTVRRRWRTSSPVAPGPHENWTRLADTVRNGRPATPIEDDPAAFYVPLVEGTFTTMFRCATRADLKIRYSALRAPRMLDLGAGGAPVGDRDADGVPRRLGGRQRPARRDRRRRTRRPPSTVSPTACELRAGDFHTIDIEADHYDIVVLGHVCRTEGARRRTAPDRSGLRGAASPRAGSSSPTTSPTSSASSTRTP